MSVDYVQVKAERYGRLCLLAVSGELDTSAADAFAARAAEAIGAPAGRMIVDMSGVKFIDCRGARALYALVQATAARCPVVVRSLRPAVRRVLDLMALDLDLFGPGLELMSLDLDPRGEPGALTGSPTGTLVQQTQKARACSQHAIADSRRVGEVIAATQDKMALTLAQAARYRPHAAERLETLSQAARAHAVSIRFQAQRPLPHQPRPICR